VVLPFANIGGGPEQDYFADGVTESLITDLSRINGAFVIAGNTAFTFKGKAVDVKKLGRELNVRYVLEGSMQRGGNRLRVNVQLVDAETGNHLWAERFDKPIADLFEMQDEIVSRLANALDAQLIAAEARRAERSLHPDAMDLVFQGTAWFNKGLTLGYMVQARSFFEEAITLDPENVEATVGLGLVDATTGGAFFDRRLVSAAHLGRGNFNQGAIARTEPRFGSHVSGPGANIYETRSSGHRSMRARTGAGSQFGHRSCSHRDRKGSSWSKRRNRTSHQRGIASFSSRHHGLSMDGMGRRRQNAPQCRCRCSRLAAPEPRRKPKLFLRAFQSRGYAGAARGAGRSASRSASGTCARSKLHHSPLS
jgi:TolB-like protein